MVADWWVIVLTGVLDDVTTAAATQLDDVTTLLNFSLQLLGTVANPWSHNDPSVYPVTVAITRNIHNHYHHFANNRTAVKVLWPNVSVDIPLAKNFQEGQLNSRIFPVFQGVVDTMLYMMYA